MRNTLFSGDNQEVLQQRVGDATADRYDAAGHPLRILMGGQGFDLPQTLAPSQAVAVSRQAELGL